jgi:Domain of unknown function (DUF4189)
MGRRVCSAIALLAFAPTLVAAVPAFAGYGAIAWDRETGKAGWIWNQPTKEKAADQAINKCGASGCKVIIRTVAKQCAALATTQDGKTAGAASRQTKDAARLAAISDCQKRKAGDCVVRASDCNK